VSGDEQEVEAVSANIVLTFQDSDGRLWLAAGYLGDLTAEKAPHEHSAPEETMPLRSVLGRAMTLVNFKVVRHEA
jgi:hypothetical protein